MSAPNGTNGHSNGFNPGPVAPPQNLEAEQSVLGAVLLSDTTLPALIIDERLQPSDFYREAHGRIYQAMLDLHGAGRGIDPLTLVEQLKQAGELEWVGGPAAIEMLSGSVPAVGNVRQYARIVRENAMLRRLLHAAYEIQAQVHGNEARPRELVDMAERAILEVAHEDSRKDFRSIEQLLHSELDKLQKLSLEGTPITGTPSGFEDLDSITGGFQPGNLIILAARPSMGKCLAGGSLILDPTTGMRTRIDALVDRVEGGEEVFVTSLGPDFLLHPARVAAARRSGVQETFRLTTRLGRQVEATANHPVLTLSGWRRLDELSPGARIAVTRRMPVRTPQAVMPDEELVLLASLIADGNLTEATPRVVGARRAAATSMGVELRGERLERVPAGSASLRARTNAGTIPPEVRHQVLAATGARSRPDVSAMAGRPRNHNWHVHSRGVSRVQLGAPATAVASPELDRLAESDVWWDEVVAIEPLGPQETYDLDVPGFRNFVADDVVVHNSALMANFAENAALGSGKAVALFSLEMSEGELAQRFIASQASIKGDDLRKGKVPQSRWGKILQASNRLAESGLFVDDSSDLSVLDVRAKSRRLAQQHADGLGLILIDYLQLMRASGNVENRVEQIGQISRGLKTLARELEVPVIALSQLNRGVEQRTDKRPVLSDLRESGAIEQDADLVMFIYRDEYYDKESEREGIADLIISKHRNGGLGTVELTFQKEFPRFMSYVGDDRY